MNNEESVDEAERRRKVVDEKLMGALIESIERMRKQPVVRSIALRLYSLYDFVYRGQQGAWVYTQAVGPSSLKKQAPTFIATKLNFLIKTYNSIIKDLQSHLGKKDAYISEFSTVDIIDNPTIQLAIGTYSMIATNILQIISYLTRWTQ